MSFVITDVTKNFGNVKALKGVSMELKKGEVVGLLGPNGAGKSTLMKILTGYYTKWEGDIHFFGQDLRTELSDIQKKTGYLPENNPLYSEMCVIEYLKFSAGLYNISKPKLAEIIQKTGLENHAQNKIYSLSKGYKQRVGLAAALIHNPDVVILDEPTTGLDPNQLIEIRKLIRDLGKDKTVILSTHILQEVDAICDRVIIINQGKIVLDESLENLSKNKEQIIEVTFDYRIEQEALVRLHQVKNVKNTYDFNYEIYVSGNDDLRPTIFDFANKNGLRILSLQLKNESLETLFNELTS